MTTLQTIANKWYTVKQLSKLFGTEKALKKKKTQYHALQKIGLGELWHSGRHNHIWIQDMLSCVTNGLFTIGGQGKKSPDMFGKFENKKVRVEHKGFSDESNIRVSASKFFANNGGMTELRECKTEKSKTDLILKHYIDDYYVLTKTNGDSMKTITDVNQIKVFLIKTSDMLPMLKDGDKVPRSILDLSEAK
jgi:hypothetical protein